MTNTPARPGTSRPIRRVRTMLATSLHAGVDTAVIALWLGHADIRSTNAYLHADMTIKQRALDLTTPTSTPPGRYRPADPLLAFPESL
jgi:integrase